MERAKTIQIWILSYQITTYVPEEKTRDTNPFMMCCISTYVVIDGEESEPIKKWRKIFTTIRIPESKF